MSISRTLATKNLGLDAEFDQLDNGYKRIYSGTRPATADTALAGNTLLAELRYAATAFGAASGGTKSANTITSDTDAAADGTATFFRNFKSDGTTVVNDGSVGVSGSGADAIINSTNIVQHTTVSCASEVYTAGA